MAVQYANMLLHMDFFDGQSPCKALTSNYYIESKYQKTYQEILLQVYIKNALQQVDVKDAIQQVNVKDALQQSCVSLLNTLYRY